MRKKTMRELPAYGPGADAGYESVRLAYGPVQPCRRRPWALKPARPGKRAPAAAWLRQWRRFGMGRVTPMGPVAPRPVR